MLLSRIEASGFRNLEGFAPGCMPDEAAAALRAAGAANDETCLRRTSQLLLLNRLFREQQIDLRIFKGIPLAITAFQDPALRDTGDLDLLVAESDVFRAGEILRNQGYVRLDPQARELLLERHASQQVVDARVERSGGVAIDRRVAHGGPGPSYGAVPLK